MQLRGRGAWPLRTVKSSWLMLEHSSMQPLQALWKYSPLASANACTHTPSFVHCPAIGAPPFDSKFIFHLCNLFSHWSWW